MAERRKLSRREFALFAVKYGFASCVASIIGSSLDARNNSNATRTEASQQDLFNNLSEFITTKPIEYLGGESFKKFIEQQGYTLTLHNPHSQNSGRVTAAELKTHLLPWEHLKNTRLAPECSLYQNNEVSWDSVVIIENPDKTFKEVWIARLKPLKQTSTWRFNLVERTKDGKIDTFIRRI